jgi:hypothetical protein
MVEQVLVQEELEVKRVVVAVVLVELDLALQIKTVVMEDLAQLGL